ncbi:hypothetical protein [Nocardiopsis synnemataformans]|uniref:hypothetical protein n=1 Tax=Nocardiopsis synnemataformans TaxID=61305 RepID=UPI003EBAD7D7
MSAPDTALDVLREAVRYAEIAQTTDDTSEALRAARKADDAATRAKKLTADLLRSSAGAAMLAGMSTEDAASHMGKTYETARQIARAHNVPRRPTRTKAT